MAQGSINMPAPGKSPIEGIMQALQAVHSYYGIDTEKAQQALLQHKLEQEKVQDPVLKGQAEAALQQQAVQKSIYADVLGNGQTQQQQVAPAPAQQQAHQEVGMSMPDGSTLMKHIDSAGQAAPAPVPQQQAPRMSPGDAFKGSMEKYGYFAPKALQEQYGEGLKNEKLAGELKDTLPKMINEEQVKFRTENKDALSRANELEEIRKDATSGNRVVAKAARERFALVYNDIKRMGGVNSGGIAPGLWNKLDAMFAESKNGTIGPEQTKEFSNAINAARTSALFSVNGNLESVANQNAERWGLSPEVAKEKMLPGHKLTNEVLHYAQTHGLRPEDAVQDVSAIKWAQDPSNKDKPHYNEIRNFYRLK